MRDGSGYCEIHRKRQQQEQDARRGNATERGYNWRWRNYRVQFLRAHPLCECGECKRLNRLLPSSVVDHIIAHKGNDKLFWDPSNHQAMAKPCHDRKTATSDGGFGRARRGLGG